MNNYFNGKKWKEFLKENKKYPVEECGGDMPPEPPPMPSVVPIPDPDADPMALAAELGAIGLDPAMAQGVIDLLLSKGLLGGVADPVPVHPDHDPVGAPPMTSLQEYGEASQSHVIKFEKETGKVSAWVNSVLDEIASHFDGDEQWQTKIPLMSDKWRGMVVKNIASKIVSEIGNGLGYGKGGTGGTKNPAWHRKEKESAEVVPFPQKGKSEPSQTQKIAAENTRKLKEKKKK